jgi:serine/threonine protein kinase/Tfp pilus assembly protein PilF
VNELAGHRLGDFEILREIGRGGMGIVYEARQLSLKRKVALKILSAGLGLTGNTVERFHREAESAARLHHTNIVPVYATGEDNGTHYYAMELIEGPSLDQVIRQLRQSQTTLPAGKHSPCPPTAPVGGSPQDLVQTGPYLELPVPDGSVSPLSSPSVCSESSYFDTVAQMIAEVADALDYAHKQGVIHRDVKPSNLLLSPQGRLSINDFGLARVLEQPGLTLTGEFVGTPAYMSPEQITSGSIPLDHRTDIYSLGATLYELLTLRPPFTGERRDQVLAQIIHREPRPPRSENRKVPLDLETICLKALDKDPDRRYQTAGQVAEDLRRYLNRFAISARRIGPLGRLRKWIRRHPGLAAASLCVLALALAAGFFAYQARLTRLRLLADRHRHDQELHTEKQRSAMDKAQLASMSGDLQAAEEAIAEAERLGASTGQARLLRGLTAFYSGNAEQAIPHLEQAVKLLPQSVAARALLANAYGSVCRWDKANELVRGLDLLTPVTPEDYLFKGSAVAIFDTKAGLKVVNEAIRLRPSPIALLIRAELEIGRAYDTADPRDGERAVKDAETARNLLPGNPVPLMDCLNARLAVTIAYEKAGRAAKRRAAIARGRDDAQALKPFTHLPDAAHLRWSWFVYVGEENAHHEELRSACEGGGSPFLSSLYGLALLREGKYERALALLEKQRGKHFTDVVRVVALAMLPGGRTRALRAYKALKAEDLYAWDWWHCQAVQLLLEPTREAVAAARFYRHKADRFPVGEREFFLALVRYLMGQRNAHSLLKAAVGNQTNVSFAHYTIAMKMLGEGDRKNALEHFRSALATHQTSDWTWHMNRVFLERLQQDPTWPPWIPAKK